MALIAVLPMALLGFGLYAVPYQIPRRIARKAGGEDDVVSTYKLGAGLVVFPVWALLLCALWWAFGPTGWLRWSVTALVVLSPFAALPWLDRLDRLAVRLRLALAGDDDGLAQLRAARDRVVQKVNVARQRMQS
jgi:hypothetical protein